MKDMFVLLALAAGFIANAGAQPIQAGSLPAARAAAVASAATPGTACEQGRLATDASGYTMTCGTDGKWLSSGIAHTADPNLLANRADPRQFCYFDGKPYSEGATVSGKTCGYPTRPKGVMVFTPNDAPRNLVWQ
ncbi:hypothetical protein ACPCHQ_21815 [Ralstonia thomasii]|uniref:hypothetical protein n=1 Tax=Ralstonia thomasii TaxID=3058596 RepID=UPI003C302542